jgi:hypothetical protein
MVIHQRRLTQKTSLFCFFMRHPHAFTFKSHCLLMGYSLKGLVGYAFALLTLDMLSYCVVGTGQWQPSFPAFL